MSKLHENVTFTENKSLGDLVKGADSRQHLHSEVEEEHKSRASMLPTLGSMKFTRMCCSHCVEESLAHTPAKEAVARWPIAPFQKVQSKILSLRRCDM